MCMLNMNYIQLVQTPDIKCSFQVLVEVTALLKIKMHFYLTYSSFFMSNINAVITDFVQWITL